MYVRLLSLSIVVAFALASVADAQINLRTNRRTIKRPAHVNGFRLKARKPPRATRYHVFPKKRAAKKTAVFPGPRGFQSNGAPQADKSADLAVGSINAVLKAQNKIELRSFVMNVDNVNYSGNRKVRLVYQFAGSKVWHGTPWVLVGNLAAKKYKSIYVSNISYNSLINANVTYRVELTAGDPNTKNDSFSFKSMLPPLNPQ